MPMLKPSLQLKLGQTLTMTPQLQQAIRLLQLPALELQAHIRELLESNVMLEPVEETEGTGTFEAARASPQTDEQPREAPAAAPKAPEKHRRSRRRGLGRAERRRIRNPWTATTTSGSRNSPTTPASRCRNICSGSSRWPSSSRANSPSRAPSSMRSATTAT